MNPSHHLLLRLAAVAAFALPAPAAASTLSLSIGPDPAAEIPTAITVSGSSDGRAELDVGSRPAEQTCTGYEGDAMSSRGVQAGAFSETATTLVDRPGQHILCAKLWGEETGTSAQAVLPYTARAPRVALVVDGPDRVAYGARVVMSVHGQVEVERRVFSALLPPGGDCRREHDLLGWQGPGGAQMPAGPFAYRFDVVPQQYGTWTLCLTTRQHLLDEFPEVLAQKRVRVTVVCTRASRALSRARDRWRGLSRWLRLHGRGPTAKLRARGRAIRRARADVGRSCDGPASP